MTKFTRVRNFLQLKLLGFELCFQAVSFGFFYFIASFTKRHDLFFLLMFQFQARRMLSLVLNYVEYFVLILCILILEVVFLTNGCIMFA